MFDTSVTDGVLRVARPDTRWLSTAWNGGYTQADAAYNITVPDGFERTDLHAYARERRTRAGYEPDGPTLLTGVAMRHARAATYGAVTCVVTAGISNPATLPMEPEQLTSTARSERPDASGTDESGTDESETNESALGAGTGPGTVNVILGTDDALDDGALATLLGTVVEAKTATLLDRTGFTGTTTDAVIVGSDPSGSRTPFAGSGTEIGRAARACVRDALTASLDARYADTDRPESVEAAQYGTVTDVEADVFDPRKCA